MWEAVAGLAEGLSDPWVLVGGLMVQLYAYEQEPSGPLRPTKDIDLLADSRERPSRTETISRQLEEIGFELGRISTTDPATAFTFHKDRQSVDVLAPDGTRAEPKTIGNLHTLPIPGGTQALRRAEEVEVTIEGGPTFRLLRPTLVGAILVKARALPVHKDPEAQRHDLVLLLSRVDDPAAMGTELRGNERKWLKAIKRRLWRDGSRDETLAVFSDTQLTQARAAYRLLIE